LKGEVAWSEVNLWENNDEGTSLKWWWEKEEVKEEKGPI